MTKLPDFDTEIVNSNFLPEIICVTETWLKPEIPNSIFTCSRKFSIFRRDRKDANGGGVMIMCANSMCSSLIECEDYNLEIITVRIKIKSDEFLLVCMYRPSVLDINVLEPLNRYLLNLIKFEVPIILAGDLNLPDIDWLRLHSPNLCRQSEFLELFCTLGMKQYVTEPTRADNILDIVLCDTPNIVSNVNVLPALANSDHETVTFNISLNHKLQEMSHAKTKLNWKNSDVASINHYLENINWQSLLNGCPDEIYDSFLTIYNFITDNFVPICNNRHESKRSIPYALSQLYKKKLVVFRKFKRSKTPETKKAYRDICKQCQQFNKSLILKRESKVLRNPTNKKFFSFVNNKFKNNGSVTSLKDGDTVIESDADKASVLNSHFSSVFISDDGFQITDPMSTVPYNISYLNFMFTRKSISDAIKTLKPDTSSGPDHLSVKFLKNHNRQLVVPLEIMFNNFLSCGILPKTWKHATVIPIYKGKGSSNKKENYRPISLTSVCCRLYEKILKITILQHLSINNVISDSQHGFLPGRSTETQLLTCVNEWCDSIETGAFVDIVYLDISKAFDTVSHPKLLSKLSAAGIDGKIYSVIENFLCDRTQSVKINESLSETSNVTSGVPQGSVLGPILFLCYINDIGNVLNNAFLKIFADDSKVYMSDSNVGMGPLLSNDICNIFTWADTNQLKMSIEKCNVLHLGYNNPKNPIIVRDVSLPSQDSVKDLGVLMSNNLKFSAHCSYIVSKSLIKSYLIFKMFSSRNRNFLIAVYKTYVRSLLESNVSVWNPSQMCDINAIERVQRKFTKRFPGLRNEPYERRLEILGLETLELRRLRFDLVMVFKILNKICDLDANDFFHLANRRSRGHSCKLELPRCRLELVRNTFKYRVIHPWNSLPENVVTSSNVYIFKNRLKNVDLSAFLKYRFD